MAQNSAGTIQTPYATPYLSVNFEGSSFIHYRKLSAVITITPSWCVMFSCRSLVRSAYSRGHGSALQPPRCQSFWARKNCSPELGCEVSVFLTSISWNDGSRARPVSVSIPYNNPLHLSDTWQTDICRRFSNDAACLFTFTRKCIICTGNVYTGTRPAYTVQLSTLLLGARPATSFTETILPLNASLLPIMTDYETKTFLAYISTSDGRASWEHAESFLQPMKLSYSGSYKYVLAVSKVPAHVSCTRSSTQLILISRSIIRFTDFFGDLTIFLVPDLSLVALSIRSSGETRGIVLISFVYWWWSVAIIPWPS